MTALESLTNKYQKNELYNAENTEAIAELYAFSEGLKLCYDLIDDTYREMFIATACDEGISEYENLISVCNMDSSLDGKRTSILSVLSLNDHNGAGFMLEKLGNIYNITGNIIEENQRLIYSTSDNLTAEEFNQIQEHMQKLMTINKEAELRTV